MTRIFSTPKSLSALIAASVFISSLSFASFASAASCSIWTDTSTAYGSATLRWTSTSDAVTAHIDGIGSVNLSGTQYVSGLSSDRTYRMRVYDNTGEFRTCETTVRVDGGGSYANYQKPSCTISLSDYRVNTVYPYESMMLSWTSWNATSASISPSVGSVGLNGSRTVYPSGYQIFTMTVNGVGGTSTCQTNSYGNNSGTGGYAGSLSCTMSASPASIQNGASSHLTWSSYGAKGAWISDGIGSVAVQGSLAVRPEASRAYTLTITDSAGRTNTCQASVTVAGSAVKLTQIPYTGDFGPLGTALSWLTVTLLAGFGATLVARRFIY